MSLIYSFFDLLLALGIVAAGNVMGFAAGVLVMCFAYFLFVFVPKYIWGVVKSALWRLQ